MTEEEERLDAEEEERLDAEEEERLGREIDELLDQFQKTRERLERHSREADRAEARYEAALARLKEETGCSAPEEAKAYLVGLRVEKRRLARQLAAGLGDFEAEWGEKLGDGRDGRSDGRA